MTLKEIFEYELISTESFHFSVFNLLLILAIYIVARVLSWGLTRVLRRRFRRRGHVLEGRRFAVVKIARYAVFVIAVLLMLANSGLDITVLVAGSTALFVGLGFGLQNLFKDFVCGITMLFEGSLELNDVVLLGEEIGKVTYIGLRTSKILTPDGITMIVPNSKFIEETVINLTKDHLTTRFKVQVGVAYDSDVAQVRQILCELASHDDRVSANPAPIVRFVEFGEFCLKFELLFWTAQNFLMEDLRSDMRFAIWDGLQKNGIVIPFPQRDLHIKSMPPDQVPVQAP